VGIVGPNGAGKSTLLKLFAGRGNPSDRGSVKRGTNLQEGYFDQHLGEVDPTLTAVDNVRRIRGDFTVEAARQYLARFRFYGDDALRVVRGFSGGERSRLAIAKLLLEPKNLLFLDEPTNHLDIPAAEILEEALVGFEGTVIVASHDRRFLENVTTRLVTVRAGRADAYPGSFRDYEDTKKAAARSEERAPAAKAKESAPKRAAPDDQGKLRYEAQRQSARAGEKRKRRIEELEANIAAGERELDVLRSKLKEPPTNGWEELTKMAQEEQALTKRVDAMLIEWARLSEEATS
jgi:ATP-binding cassette subfamily F protein 3